VPTNGASGAIARSIETLTRDLREKKTLPTYTKSELAHLVEAFISKKNPTSMASLESSSVFACRQVLDSIERKTIPDEQHHYSNDDFAPLCNLPQKERTFQEIHDEANEYKDLIEEKILEEIRKDEEALLQKILIGG
jgi:hypothetical protein